MSDYSKITNFLSKDSLALNDPAKYVKGSELDAEYNAIAVAVATKADTASPTLVTPTLGVATATSINKITLMQPAAGATLTILNGKTLTINHTLTLAGTDGTTMTFPATSATLARIDAAQTFVGTQTFSGLIAANLGLTVAGADFASRGITDSATAKALTLSGSGANSVTISNSATNPTISTSGGALILRPNTVDVSLRGSNAGAANISVINEGTGYASFSATSSGIVPAYLFLNNTTNGEQARLTALDGGTLAFGTSNTATTQLQINHTAFANRYITLTGSNGANPKIGTNAGQLTLGTGSALATSATEGYVCIPTCAGAPTGVPTGAGAGNLPLIYDTTNNKLYAYNGAWKATAALT